MAVCNGLKLCRCNQFTKKMIRLVFVNNLGPNCLYLKQIELEKFEFEFKIEQNRDRAKMTKNLYHKSLIGNTYKLFQIWSHDQKNINMGSDRLEI